MSDNEATLLVRIKKVGGDVLDGLKDTMSAVKDVTLGLGGAIVGFGALAVHAFKEAQAASNELSQSMVQQGIYTTALKKKYDEMAGALADVSLFEDNQITSAQAILQRQLGQKEVTQDLVKATLDLAQAKKMDLSSAADLVGKAIASENNVLARHGIELEATNDKSKRLTDVVQKLNAKFGGQAEAATQGLGALDMLKKAGGEFMEEVGGRLAPVIGGIANKLLEFVNSIRKSEDAMNGIMAVFEAVGQIGIVLKGTFEIVGKVIGNVLGGIAGTIGELIQGNFKNAMNQAVSIATVSADDISGVWAKGKEEMKELNGMFLKGMEEDLAKEEELVKQSEARKLEIKKEAAAMNKEFFITKNAEELEEQALFDQIKQDQATMQRLKDLNDTIKHSNDKMLVLQAQTQKEKIIKDAQAQLDIDRQTGLQKIQAFLDSEKVKNTQTTLGTISTLQQSHSKELVAIGKAAAMANAIVNTAQGVSLALATFPPPVNFVMAGLVAAAGAVQIGTIAGVQMAEGGLVKATPGGVAATIGEGGRDEAVIPLDDPATQERLGGLGGGMTVHFHGPVLGDEAQADAFARQLDRAFMRLRQRNESVAFESDLT